MRPGRWDDSYSERSVLDSILHGDGLWKLGMALMLAIYVGALFSYGYAPSGMARGIAWGLCGAFGIWGLFCWTLGRFRQDRFAGVMWALCLWGVTIAWAGLQLVPLPSGIISVLSPSWRETFDMMEVVGYSRPTKVPFTINPEAGMASWNQMLASFLFFVGVVVLASRRSGFIFVAAMVGLSSVVVGWLGLAGFILGTGTRAAAILYNPNHYAAFVMLGLPLAVWWLSLWGRGSDEESNGAITRDRAIFGGVIWAVALMGWLLALSRGSLLAFSVVGVSCTLLYLLTSSQSRSRGGDTPRARRRAWGLDPKIIGWTTAGILILFVASGAFGGFADRTPGSDSFASRFGYWLATLQGLAGSPFLGYGIGGTEGIINRFSVNDSSAFRAIWSHNDYVQLLGELGLVWALVFVVLMVMLVRRVNAEWSRVWRAIHPRARGLRSVIWIGILIAAVHAMVEFHLRIPLVGFQFLALSALLLTGPRVWTQRRD